MHLNSFRDATKQSIAEAFEDISTRTGTALSLSTAAVEAAVQNAAEKLDTALSKFSENSSRLENNSGKLDRVIGALVEKIGSIDVSPDMITKRLEPGIASIDEVVKRLQSRMSQEDGRAAAVDAIIQRSAVTVAQFEKVSTVATESTLALRRAVEGIGAADRQTERFGTAAHKAAEALARFDGMAPKLEGHCPRLRDGRSVSRHHLHQTAYGIRCSPKFGAGKYYAMPSPIVHQEGSYRRGLVLGFTVAEIMMLILFALLLAFAYAFALQRTEIDGLRGTIAVHASAPPPLGEDALRFGEFAEKYWLANTPERDPKEYFTELTTSVQRAADLTRQLAQTQQQLAEANKKIDGLRSERDELQSQAAAVQSVLSVLKEAGISPPTNFADLERLQQIIRFGLLAYEQAAKASGQNGALDPRIIDMIKSHIWSVGSGGEHPSCWVDPETRKAEPLFNISIMDSSYRIEEHFLADRVEDRKALPLSGISYDSPLSAAQFNTAVRSVYIWSTQQKPECRFHVEIYDRTSDTAKNAYKLGDQTIQGFFYPIKERIR